MVLTKLPLHSSRPPTANWHPAWTSKITSSPWYRNRWHMFVIQISHSNTDWKSDKHRDQFYSNRFSWRHWSILNTDIHNPSTMKLQLVFQRSHGCFWIVIIQPVVLFFHLPVYGENFMFSGFGSFYVVNMDTLSPSPFLHQTLFNQLIKSEQTIRPWWSFLSVEPLNNNTWGCLIFQTFGTSHI